ncbi:MAG TPA: hypothetical protein VF794_27770 [Archangium sp.]|jgi:hypothetical protein|uniref:hypothetical protein n=1 Tax=Archangium sp. TaxID=1872627 RepID=UPI002ED8C389
MNARLLAAFLCLATLGTGCIIVDHGGDHPNPPPTGSPGDVSFLWTFGAEGRCVDVPDVKSIKLSIPGETLDSNGFYACNTAGVDGITLRNFRAGTYSYTLQAFDAYNKVLYSSSGSFTVNGNKQVRVDMTPDGKTYAYVSWYFPAKGSYSRPTCSQANVTSIKASIDNGEWVSVDCLDGTDGDGIPTPYLEPGTHTLQLIAYGYDIQGRANMPLYNLQGTLTTQRGVDAPSVEFRFFELGGMSVRWDMWDGTNYRNCAETGLTSVVLNLLDLSTNKVVYEGEGLSYDCVAAPVVNQFMKPGSYQVRIRGYVGSTMTYSNENNMTTLTVKAFEQKKATDAATVLVMSKQ